MKIKISITDDDLELMKTVVYDKESIFLTIPMENGDNIVVEFVSEDDEEEET